MAANTPARMDCGRDDPIGIIVVHLRRHGSCAAIHPGGSIGSHKQESGDDLNYVISGKGKAACDGVEEELKPGVMHICPKGSEHSIINTGEEDLVMLTVVVKK